MASSYAYGPHLPFGMKTPAQKQQQLIGDIGRYGAPQGPDAGGGGGPDFSFLDPNSPNYNAGLAQGSGSAGSGSGGAFDPNTLANVRRDVGLSGQYGNLLAANNLYGQQQEALQRAGIGSAERYGSESSALQVQGINSAERYGQDMSAITQRGIGDQAKQAQYAAGVQERGQTSQAAASGSTTSQGNRQAFADIHSNLDFTMRNLYSQLQQLAVGNRYRQEGEYQQLMGISNSDRYRRETEYQQLQGIGYGSANREANYNYQQAQNQTSIADQLQPYGGVTP